jgi:hypothetical protein
MALVAREQRSCLFERLQQTVRVRCNFPATELHDSGEHSGDVCGWNVTTSYPSNTLAPGMETPSARSQSGRATTRFAM